MAGYYIPLVGTPQIGDSGGGGGGGGGWKTIPVKFVNSDPGGGQIGDYYVENLSHLENNVLSNGEVTVPANGDVTLDILAYGDGITFGLMNIFDNLSEDVVPTGTGGVSVSIQNHKVTITGEGTFTAAGNASQ